MENSKELFMYRLNCTLLQGISQSTASAFSFLFDSHIELYPHNCQCIYSCICLYVAFCSYVSKCVNSVHIYTHPHTLTQTYICSCIPNRCVLLPSFFSFFFLAFLPLFFFFGSPSLFIHLNKTTTTRK